jgi:hypothetical protein
MVSPIPTPRLLEISRESNASEACICGGVCARVYVTCLDCQEGKAMPWSEAKAFERIHGGGSHAIIVSHPGKI